MGEECKRLAREHGDLAALERCVESKENARCEERAAFCPLYRTMARWKDWGIPERERKLLRGDLLATKPLAPWLPLKAMKARLAHKAGPQGMKGTETLIVLAGKCDEGKTLAATWALSRTGGYYVTACQFAGLKLDFDALKRANTLVIDQLGTEPSSDSEWAFSHILDVVDVRYANLRLTILCSNMLRGTFETRYTNIVARRLRDDGVFIRVGGET